MTSLTTTPFKTLMATQFLESLQSAEDIYYMFAAKCTSWPNELIPPTPVESMNEIVFNTWDNMLFGKLIANSNVKLMASRYNWVSNTVYTMYDDQDSTLLNENFYVVVNANTSYDIFKCLYNNNNTASTVSPSRSATTEADPFYFTSDGYQWKYLYSVDATTFATFATPDFIPYVPNANTTGNAVMGSISTILIANNGTQYNSYSNGYFQEI